MSTPLLLCCPYCQLLREKEYSKKPRQPPSLPNWSIIAECGNCTHDHPSARSFYLLPPFHGVVEFFIYEDFLFWSLMLYSWRSKHWPLGQKICEKASKQSVKVKQFFVVIYSHISYMLKYIGGRPNR